MTQRLYEPTRTAWFLRRPASFQRGLLVLGPVAVVLCVLTATPLWPVEPTPAELDDVRWALPSVVVVATAALAMLRTEGAWARWLMATGVALAVVRWAVDPLGGEPETIAGRTATLAAAFGFCTLLPWLQDSHLAHRFRAWRARRRPGGQSAAPSVVTPEQALDLLRTVLPDGFGAGLRDGRACAWWTDEATGRSVVVHTPGRGWVSAEVESGHADVQLGDGGPDELTGALRRAVAVADAYRSGGPVVDDRRTGTPRGGELGVLVADGWHVLRRPAQLWADRTARRAWDAVRSRRRD
ncbi:hypothetical protein [Aeromicrobium massiliense]|uniref:hypothetical protein n=1 Tax=Aeromicrobium massiliense TaxID=1464554 RepID=UPI00031B23C8|nr:hypothetical protein [Aeromicrobium massiliense]